MCAVCIVKLNVKVSSSYVYHRIYFTHKLKNPIIKPHRKISNEPAANYSSGFWHHSSPTLLLKCSEYFLSFFIKKNFCMLLLRYPGCCFFVWVFFSHIVRQFLSTSQFTGLCKSDATFLHSQPDLRFHSCSQHKHCRTSDFNNAKGYVA